MEIQNPLIQSNKTGPGISTGPVMALMIGVMMEEYLRRAILMSRGDPSIFITRPISSAILVVAVIALVVAVIPAIRSKHEEAFQE